MSLIKSSIQYTQKKKLINFIQLAMSSGCLPVGTDYKTSPCCERVLLYSYRREDQ
jgi:hypothetical protein